MCVFKCERLRNPDFFQKKGGKKGLRASILHKFREFRNHTVPGARGVSIDQSMVHMHGIINKLCLNIYIYLYITGTISR